MNRRMARIGALAVLSLLLLLPCVAAEEKGAGNPLLEPQELTYMDTQQRYFNILLAGIDLGRQGYSGSFGKMELSACHADAMLVASLNLDTGALNLISLPRDTITYVPGVRGIYKLNGAFNCGDTIEEGLLSACRAASWLLGGVEVSKYCAIDMNAMIALGDAIGGVEYDMDMNYVGSSGRKYRAGVQQLDGMGIMDYLRARQNATREGTDLGRTQRQRDLMLAIFEKIRNHPSLVTDILGVLMDPGKTMMTNVGVQDLVALAPAVLSVKAEEVGSYVLAGSYRPALDGWNFTFTDQARRMEVIAEVFGVEAQPLSFVSHDYCEWLMEHGFSALRYLGSAQAVYDSAGACSLTAEQEAELAALGEACAQLVACFEAAALSLAHADTNRMVVACMEARDRAKEMASALSLEDQIAWSTHTTWYEDPRINEYQYAWE